MPEVNGSPVFDDPGNESPARSSLWGPARAPAESTERPEYAEFQPGGPPTEPIAAIPPEPSGAVEEPLPASGGAKSTSRVKVVIGAAVTAFAAVTAVIVVSAVTYRPAPRSDANSQVLGAGSGAGAYSSYAPTYAPTYVLTETPTPTTASTTETSSATSMSYSPGAVPDGYQRVTGPAGVSVSIPADWSVQRGAFATTDEADAPDGSGSIIRYSGSPTPVLSLRDAVVELERNTPTIRKEYERLRLDELASGDVVWEFRFTTKAGVQRHALGRYWRANDHDYAVYGSVDEFHWTDFQPTLDVLVQTAAPR